mmetsp:Transcript_14581/g.29334  ORF Transcript_14581/g.29334 Transcript_14581/m.29334 type:complete len:341 (-) Transcript_14581:488-1510(-)
MNFLATIAAFAPLAAATDIPWTYESQGISWPTNDLIENNECGGAAQNPRQSPIDFIPSEIKPSDASLTWNYAGPVGGGVSTVPYFLDAHIQIQIGTTDGAETFGNLTFNGETFIARQYHFHAAAEHTVDSYRYPLELHLVHTNVEGSAAAVTGFVFTEGKTESKFLAAVLENGVPEVGEVIEIPVDESKKSRFPDPNLLFEKKITWWNYEGSLTLPPCSEFVEWFWNPEPIIATREQISAFARVMTNPPDGTGTQTPPNPGSGNFRTTVNFLNTDATNKNVKAVTGTGTGGKGADGFSFKGVDGFKIPEFSFDFGELGKFKDVGKLGDLGSLGDMFKVGN